MTGQMPKEIATALVKATREAQAIEKDRTATIRGKEGKAGFSYSFVGADSIMAEVREALAKVGLAICLSRWEVTIAERDRRLAAWFVLVHEQGDSHEVGPYSMASLPGPGRPEDKADAAALTYLTGYALRGLLNLPRVEAGSQPDEREDEPVTLEDRLRSIATKKDLFAFLEDSKGRIAEEFKPEVAGPWIREAATRLGGDPDRAVAYVWGVP